MTPLGPTLTTARLILRPPALEDFEPWAAMMAVEEVARFIGGLQPPPVVWRAMMSMAGGWALQGFGMFSVLQRDTGHWIGRVGPLHPHGWPGDEVGWGLIRDAWGRGYAYEASVACMDYVVDRLGWTDIIHSIAPENLASQAVARRLGSSNRGPGRLPAPHEDAVVDLWGQTAQDWRSRRATL